MRGDSSGQHPIVPRRRSHHWLGPEQLQARQVRPVPALGMLSQGGWGSSTSICRGAGTNLQDV